MTATPAQEIQEEFLSTVSKSQETVLDALKTWIETVQSITPKLPSPSMPLATSCPSPKTSWPAPMTSLRRCWPASGSSPKTC